MIPAVALFLALGFLSLIFVVLAWVTAWRLTLPAKRRAQMLWLARWSLKGLALPLALWAVLNAGVSWNLQPLMPQVQAAQNSGGNWLPEFLGVAGAGMFIISSYWAALTLGWLLALAGAQMEKEALSHFKGLCLMSFFGLLLPALLILLLGGWPTLGLAATLILTPVAAAAPGILETKPLRPIYARAIARMKFGKYNEAELEIIRELEKREDDFEGWMMLAELYAGHFSDLREAERTILELCQQPGTTPSQLSVALHRLADWHLKSGGDPESARRVLQMIPRRLPSTHLAHMAQLRINQLPATAQELREQPRSRPIPLPALGDHFDDAPAATEAMPPDQAAAAAIACVERLKQNPNNIVAREQLARLFADRLSQPERGIEQLSLLFEMSDQEPARRAEWLGLIAAWQIKYRHDNSAGRQALERILAEFPKTPQALAARRRLQLMDAESASSS